MCPPLQALPIEISLEPVDQKNTPERQRVEDFRRVARDHCVHLHTHHYVPTLRAVVEAVDTCHIRLNRLDA